MLELMTNHDTCLYSGCTFYHCSFIIIRMFTINDVIHSNNFSLITNLDNILDFMQITNQMNRFVVLTYKSLILADAWPCNNVKLLVRCDLHLSFLHMQNKGYRHLKVAVTLCKQPLIGFGFTVKGSRISEVT